MAGNSFLRYFLIAGMFLAGLQSISAAKVYYVATSGSNSNAGTIDAPFQTISKAVGLAVAGDSIFVRGGTFISNARINISTSGTASAMIYLGAYPGEKVLLDCSGMAQSGSNQGISLTASYWHIKGISIKGAGDNGMNISKGSYNIIENCEFYENRDSGLQLGGGASNNKIINCDSYYNADPTDYGDADGFAAKLDVGSGNYFYGCRAWLNVDDGWDGYLRGANDISTTAENCWAFKNGYFKDGTDAGPNANGNGFKMGGSDDKTLMHNYTLKNCLAFENKAKGFDQNNNKGSMTLYNCTAYNNVGNNYSISQALNAGKTLTVKNCVALGNYGSIGSFAIQATNSWMSPFVVTAADFLSINSSEAFGPRKADGSLPDITYMHLAPGSDLIDAGTDVGIPYNGSKPDLGAWETGAPVAKYTLSVNISGSGLVTLDPSGGEYSDGAVVTATAVPDAGNEFLNWTGDATGTDASITIVMNGNKTVTANFQPVTGIRDLGIQFKCFPTVTNDFVNVKFDLLHSQNVSFSIVNFYGVTKLNFGNKIYPAGQNLAQIDLSGLPSGYYLCRIVLNEKIVNIKVLKE